jgi:hypothetical protein
MADDESLRPAMRASDADRDRVVDVLSAHAGEGRLTVDELSERTDAAYAAKTLGELDILLADLPATAAKPAGAPAVPEEAQVWRGFRGHVTSYMLVMVLLVAIWAITGADYFWPVWPALGWGVAVAIDLLRTREEAAEIRSAAPEKRPAIAARSAERRHHDVHRAAVHRLPGPPPPPRP